MSSAANIKAAAADFVTEVVKKVSVEGMIAGVGVLGTICTGGALPVVTSVAGIVAAMALFGAVKLNKAAKDRAKDEEQAKHCERVSALLEQLKHGQSAAHDRLADIALQQSWFKDAMNQGPDAFNAAWKNETAACADALKAQLADLKADTTQIRSILAELAHLEFDTNWRVREIAATTARTETKVDALNATVLSESQQIKAAIENLASQLAASSPQLDHLRVENDALKEQLRAVTERYVASQQAIGRNWREVIEELRHDPKKLGEFLDTETDRTENDLIEQHRERAAVWYTTGEIAKTETSLRKILALRPDDLDATNSLGRVMFLRGDLDKAKSIFTRVGELAPNDSWRAASFGNLGLIERTRGNLDGADKYIKQSLAINETLGSKAVISAAYANLGVIEETRGNLDAAEEYHKKALTIHEELGHQEGMAANYGNLGAIERTRGNLDAAEKYIKKSLAISETLGSKEGMAIQYGNLGLIEHTRGNLDAAEEYLKKALAINMKLGSQEGIANCYGNLGLIERTRGHLDAAEKYIEESLRINEKLALQEGMATQYGSLSQIEHTRGDLDAAETYLKKSLAINEKLGRQGGIAANYIDLGCIELSRGNLDASEGYLKKCLTIVEMLGSQEGVAKCYSNLGNVEMALGHLDAAEEYVKKSLAIEEMLGQLEGMAADYGNLGVIEKRRGNLGAAQSYFEKSLDINEKLGKQEGVATVYANLGAIEQNRGNTNEARRLWTLSRDLFRKLGAKDREAQLQSWLNSLDFLHWISPLPPS